MTIYLWNGTGDWNLNPTDWGLQDAAPPANANTEIQTGSATITSSGVSNFLTIDANAAVDFGDDALLTLGHWLNNSGSLNVTGSGDKVTVGGRLINAGALNIGGTSLTAATSMSATALRNTGSIVVQGSPGGTSLASLAISGAASATLSGSIRVAGDGQISFGSGNITAIGVGATLELDGSQAVITTGSASASALGALAINKGTVQLHGKGADGAGGATLTTTTALTNEGTFALDANADDGASSLTIGAALKNEGSFSLGNSVLSASDAVKASLLVNVGTLVVQGNAATGSKNEALLTISGTAAATLTGNVRVSGDAAIAFGSGAITAIQSGSSLELDGAGTITSVGAASGLATLTTNNGTLALVGGGSNGAGGAKLTTSAGVNFTNNGVLDVDAFTADGGSMVTFGGALDNNGFAYIGSSSLVASTTVKATSLANVGTLIVQGSLGEALLSISGAASSSLTGNVRVSGEAEIAYGSGDIAAILAGSSLELDGAAVIKSGALSALADLGANDGQFLLQDANVQSGVAFTNNGMFQVDYNTPDGGSSAGFGGVFANHGTTYIGNASLSEATEVSATGLDNSGILTVQGNAGGGGADQASLVISGTAAAALTGEVRISGNAAIAFGGGQITSILNGSSLELDGANAQVTTSGGSALAQLATNNGSLSLQGGSGVGAGGATLAVKTGFTNDGSFYVDSSGNNSGSSATFTGAFDNNGTTIIGETNLSTATTVTAATLVNAGLLTVQGAVATNAQQLATLNITGAAAAALTGIVRVSGAGEIIFGSGLIGSIGSGSSLELDGVGAKVLTKSGASSALAQLTVNDGSLVLQGGDFEGGGGAKLVTTMVFSNNGTLDVDAAYGDGGSIATFGGAWTNNGAAVIGNVNLSTSTTVKTAAFNNNNQLILQGNASLGSTDLASLLVTGSAPSATNGPMRLSGDALLQFTAGGQITSVAGESALELDGAGARITTGGSAVSALAQLSANYGTLTLRGNCQYGLGGAMLATTVAFANGGSFSIDAQGGDGASVVNLGGILTNNESLDIGNNNLSTSTTLTALGLVNYGSLALQGNVSGGSTDQATMNISGAAAATIVGPTRVGGDALLEFGSGEITEVAGQSDLEIDGAEARITTGGATASALATLTENEGTLQLRGNSNLGAGGAALTTTTAFTNDGAFLVDTQGGDGASTVKFGAGLTNDQSIVIGNNNLSALTTVTATALTNNGALTVQGNTSGGSLDQATLDITGAATALLSSPTRVGGDALLEFGTGAITTIAGMGYLELDGAGARITTNGATKSALATLGANYGELVLRGNSNLGGGGAALTTTSTPFYNGGQLMVDYGDRDGGSTVNLGGVLTNDGTVDIGQRDLSATTTVTASGLINDGALNLQGNSSGGATDQAILDITGAAAATTNGPLRVSGDAVLEFASGALTSIGAAGYLEIDGADAEITVGGTKTSALAKLAINNGTLLLTGNSFLGAGGASLTTSGGFVNDDSLWLDVGSNTGGSMATFAGVLTNNGSIVLGNSNLTGATTLTTASLDNIGSLTLYGSNGGQSQVIINGAAANSGDLNINYQSEVDVTGANAFTQSAGATIVGGTLIASTINANDGVLDYNSAISAGDGIATMNIGANGTLEFGASVDNTHSVTFGSATGTLALGALQAFAGSISGFAGDDVIDLLNGGASSFTYAGNTTSGTLTLNEGSTTVGALAMKGNYTPGSFQLASDGHGGANVLFL